MSYRKAFSKGLAIILSSVVFLTHSVPTLISATLTGGSVTLSDSRPSTASVTYTIDFDNVTTSAIKCIKVKFSDAVSAGSKPTSMNVSSAALGGSSDYIPTPASWSVSANNTTGVVDITYATGETPAGASDRTVILSGITNGATADTTYYVQFSTFNNTDCSSSAVDSGTISFIYTTGQAVSATVDSTLSFTISAVNSGQTVNSATTTDTSTTSTIPFGALSSSANQIAAHDLAIGTNANNGYTVTIKHTGGFTNGTDTIDVHAGTNASPTTFTTAGTEAWAYTTEDTTLGTGTAGRFGSGKWAGFDTTAYEVAYNGAAASQTIRTGYQAGISATTGAGSYSTTVVYTATPTY